MITPKLAKPLLLSAGVSILSFLATPALALDFNFSFTNDPSYGNVPGTVAGRIQGLVDNMTSPATGVFIDSAPAALGFGSLPVDVLTFYNTIESNSFTVASGQVVGLDFYASTNYDIPWFWLNHIGINYLGNPSNNNINVWNQGGFGGITFTPVPAPLPIFGAAFAYRASRKIRRRLAARR